ncbi:fimbrial protein [Collimonas silvisoli]|uniref:fimbrial protein n=1 Tax=Collimonas silvisoli TaxID=2825884 RepID=UPI001E2F7E98|nr:fimbrial protein [Collimonas silvisoli]
MKILRKNAGTWPCLALLTVSGAQAACFRVPGASVKTIQMDMGTVVIPNDAAIGAVFASQNFPIPIAGDSEAAFQCDSAGGTTNGNMLQGSLVAGYPNVYTTLVPGVGIRLSRLIGQISGAGVRTYYPHILSFPADVPVRFYNPSYFTVELVKIAAKTGNGPFAAGTYTIYYGNGDYISAITTILSGNGITIVTPSCAVDAGSKNIPVNFGDVDKNRFKGVGSTAADRPFNIKLNCQRGENMQNTILLKMSATADPSNQPGVLRLKQVAGVATGVGIQLLDKNSAPVRFGTAATVGTSADITYTVPFTARYYQTAAAIKPGPANGEATFTVEYQ